MSGLDNDTLFFDNGIDTREEGVNPVENQMTTDGQLLIAAASGQKIRVGSLTSNDASVTLTYSEPSSTTNALDLSAGAAVPTSFKTNDGNTATPVANELNVLGIEETLTRSSGNTVSIFSPRVARFVVDPTLDRGTHQTITAAMAAASSGDTIFVRPGTYTEDFTIKAGVVLTGTPGSQNVGETLVSGKITMSAVGQAAIAWMYLQTNGDYFLETSGSTALSLRLYNCFLHASDNDGINHANSNAAANIFIRESASTQASGQALVTNSSAGSTLFYNCDLGNGGGTITASTASSGGLAFRYCSVNFPITTSSDAGLTLLYSRIPLDANNATAITAGGTGTTIIEHCDIEAGTATAITVGAGVTVQLRNSIVASDNAAAISGDGTIFYNAYWTGTSNTVTVSTKNNIEQNSGGISFDHGTNTLANYAEGTWTPVITGSTTPPDTITYSTQVGSYTRVGDLVWAHATVSLATFTLGAGAGQIRLEGFPFTAENTASLTPICAAEMSGVNYGTAGASITGQLQPNTVSMAFLETVDDTSVAAIALSGLAAGDTIRISVTYKV